MVECKERESICFDLAFTDLGQEFVMNLRKPRDWGGTAFCFTFKRAISLAFAFAFHNLKNNTK